MAIVVYADAAGMVLSPTSGAEKATILDALSRLEAGGSTAGGAGICLATAGRVHPAQVKGYRLIGYENRRLRDEESGRARTVRVGSGEHVRFPVGDFQDGEYAIDAAADSDGLDPVLYLYRWAGNRLVEIASDDDGGDHRNSRIRVRLDSTEAYVVGVKEYSGLPGPVELSVSRVPSSR